ncbi:MAG: hypothetical protein VYE15_06060, partial [Myxococcota bacterium]|nr:hypothetical protein [Myxococcota bacterium]
LSDALDDLVGEGLVGEDLLQRAAEEANVPVSHVYIAAGLDPDFPWSQDQEVTFVVCSGECQSWGSVDRIDHLVAARTERLSSGRAGFNILTRGCLNTCEHPPAIPCDSPGSSARLPRASREDLDQAIAAFVDGQDPS